MFEKKFFDKYWNFDNKKFIKLLEIARKKHYQNKKEKKIWWAKLVLFKSASKKEVRQVINKLSIFINSWLDIKWALIILTKQIKNHYLKDIIEEVKENLDHWIALNDSLRSYPKIFDNLVVSLIKVWETTWKLWEILKQIDKTLLESMELTWKVKWAMIYPIILLSITFSMLIFMLTFIVPKISMTFHKAWFALPWPTQFIVNISNFLTHEYINIIISIIAIVIFIKLINSNYYWKMFFAIMFTKIPIFWNIIKQSNIIYFINSFTILLDSWVLLLESIKISSFVVPNLAYKRELIRIKNEVEIWLPISKSLWLNLEYESNIYLNKLFPEDFAYIINTGEETWTLSNSLKKLWKNYQSELKRYIWNLSNMLEPFIIVIVWVLIWWILISIMLPFFEMWKVAKNM